MYHSGIRPIGGIFSAFSPGGRGHPLVKASKQCSNLQGGNSSRFLRFSQKLRVGEKKKIMDDPARDSILHSMHVSPIIKNIVFTGFCNPNLSIPMETPCVNLTSRQIEDFGAYEDIMSIPLKLVVFEI